MSPAGTPGAPSLSQIVGWDTAHLYQAATDWVNTAEHWEDSFASTHHDTLSPGGTSWEGQAAEAAQQRAMADLIQVGGLADTLHEASEIARRGADQLDYLKRDALNAINQAREAGFSVSEDLSVTDSSRGGRIAAARSHAAVIAGRAIALSTTDNELASRITATTAELSNHRFIEPPENGGVQAVDFKEAPPPSSPYPINDVVADATDLDGNHVVMRRGYYDAQTQQGFGFDKAYWRHGVINPNVFKDLISHSRPISNTNGTLVYEVPINRVHCTSGPLGIPSCNDTGESLTMRIVANINGSPTVPGGGQKGLITMYPIAGGSGVVELGPNWTWTPPWVNNNVPIN
ncbi:hypothetical protein [Mycobacterium sp. RTGN5]|uniref:hypothetical protein n=1 Tax=Mycobacterium sp. RTGN5 TaxID=3016522 RepID=UPI0029C712C7|nr:hypothetical protein [Mycobacterium sp. RTGN5]